MKPIIKNTLIGIASFVAFRFYKMYELGASIIIKPLDYSFGRVDWANLNKGGVPLYVQLEILNPSNTSLKMRGIDGVLKFNDKIISTFISKPFTISAGRSTFNLDFKLNGITAINEFIAFVKENRNDKVEIDMSLKIPYFTLKRNYKLSITKSLYDSLFK
jgi:LEA14-like dessication related protein